MKPFTSLTLLWLVVASGWLPAFAQATPPYLGAGGISGAVGGGQAAGAQVPVASPPPPPFSSGYTPSSVVPNAAVNPGTTGILRSTVVTSRRAPRTRRMLRRRP